MRSEQATLCQARACLRCSYPHAMGRTIKPTSVRMPSILNTISISDRKNRMARYPSGREEIAFPLPRLGVSQPRASPNDGGATWKRTGGKALSRSSKFFLRYGTDADGSGMLQALDELAETLG